MALIAAFKRSREEFLDRHSDADAWQARLFSGTTYSLWLACREVMAKQCTGLVLDAGSGRGSWRETILRRASGYESIDVAPRGGDVPTWTGDITHMPQVPDGRYGTVVCHQVLEHVRAPWRALEEFHRVLHTNGTLIASAPHLSRRHELPYDYFRFTQEGLTAMLQDAGYVDINVRPYGGVLSFLHHQTSFLFPGLLSGIPVLGTVAAALNAPFSWLACKADRLIDRAALMPVGILATARKP